jgi:hypothetical protein
MKRWAAAPGSLAVVCFLTAGSSVAETSPASPGPFASQADQIVADLAAGNFTAVQGKFDPAMMNAAWALPLHKAWTALPGCAGYVSKPRCAAVCPNGPKRPRTGTRHVGRWAGRGHHHLQPRPDHCGVALRSQGVPSVLSAACEMPFGRCGFAGDL